MRSPIYARSSRAPRWELSALSRSGLPTLCAGEIPSGFAAPRWYQVNVTGGSVAGNLLPAATWDPDGSNVIHRFLPSLAVNRIGDMALGYGTSSSTTKPAIKYAGRLATDPINTFSQTEQALIQGRASAMR